MKSLKAVWAVPFALTILLLFRLTPTTYGLCVGPMLRVTTVESSPKLETDEEILRFLQSNSVNKPFSAAAGTEIVLHGLNFAAACNDVNTRLPSPPAKRIDIYFEQGIRKVLLGTIDANSSRTFSFRVNIPPDTAEGTASLIATFKGIVGNPPKAAIAVKTLH